MKIAARRIRPIGLRMKFGSMEDAINLESSGSTEEHGPDAGPSQSTIYDDKLTSYIILNNPQ